jgi:hypothetical protein
MVITAVLQRQKIQHHLDLVKLSGNFYRVQ